MLSNLKIIRLRDMLSVKPEGNLDRKKLKEGLQEIASVHGAFVEYDVLIDTRGTEDHLSLLDIWEASRDLANAVHAGSPNGFWAKIAILCPVERFDNAKFFQLCSQDRGLNVRTFTVFEDMFEWLSKSSDPNSDNSP
jgi:hypothetical protein